MGKINNIITNLSLIILLTSHSSIYANQELHNIFPLANYNQNVSAWIKPDGPHYNEPLLSPDMQQKRMELFYDHYIGEFSPWNANYVTQILRQTAPNDFISVEQSLLIAFSNADKTENNIGYGENFRPYAPDWLNAIANNVDITQFIGSTYHDANRGIAIDNLHARALPTHDVHFYNPALAGEGYPFDNLQMSALWAGTPVYILGESRDHAWLLVITPEYIAWVNSHGIARTDRSFVDTWSKAAKHKLLAITRTQTSLLDEQGKFILTAYVGTVFPAGQNGQLMVPVAGRDHHATVKYAEIANKAATSMPLTATPHHFADIMSAMIGRPYGWGSMYFYNDCSAELKSLLTPFGIWLPRHSSDQVTVGNMVDMTAATQDKRLAYLMENGQPFITIIYIGGHVILYMGNYSNNGSEKMAMTYQNIWGLSPNPSITRYIIGKSVLFPMLLQYPENPSLVSLAAKKYFQVAYLNQLPTTVFIQQKAIDIKSLMYPEGLLKD